MQAQTPYSKLISRCLLLSGAVKSIFASLQDFKQYDPVLQRIYGFQNAIYNFRYVLDFFEILTNLLQCCLINQPSISYFERECLSKLELFINVVSSDLSSHELDYNKFNETNPNFLDAIKMFLTIAKETLYKCSADKSICLIIDGLIEKFNTKVVDYVNKAKQAQSVYIDSHKIAIKCFSEKNYPFGENRILYVSASISFYELVIQIEKEFSTSPINLFYINAVEERQLLNSPSALQKFIVCTKMQAKCEYKLIVSSPLLLQKTDLNLNSFQKVNINSISVIQHLAYMGQKETGSHFQISLAYLTQERSHFWPRRKLILSIKHLRTL
jgi:hypothetical protein